jgi:Flp pilus assembly CpaF family ATPase
MQIRVAITSPDGEAERAPEFSKAELSIGRLPSNDVVLPEAGVSSNHARVLVTGATLTILDLDSTNGTFVNGEAVQGPRVLVDDDEVQIGDFVLRFALLGRAREVDLAGRPAASNGRASAPAGGGWGGGADAGGLPPPPPMMDELDELPEPHFGLGARDGIGGDDLDAPELAVRRAPTAMVGGARRAEVPRSEPPRPAAFPRFEAVVAARSAGPVGFEFTPASAQELIEQVFTAVWQRIADEVLLSVGGVAQTAAALLDEALQRAGEPLRAQAAALRARMLDEMVGPGPLRAVLDGEPNEVLVHGIERVRVQRAGQVSEGPSGFTCAAALRCFASRCLGLHYDPSVPHVRGQWGPWAVEAMWGAGVPLVISLRRSVLQGTATLEGLQHAGVMSPGMAALLSTCAVARYGMLVVAAPGASARHVLAAALAAGSPQELQVVVTHRGTELSGFRPGTVAVARSGQHDAIDAALALAPDRLAIDDLQWSEARGALAVIGRAIGVVVGMRGHSPAAGLARLGQLLGGELPGVVLEPLVAHAFDLVIGVQLFADGISRVTQIAEAYAHEGRAVVQDIFTLVPGTRSWQVSATAPRCHEELARRGFRLDPAIFT